MKIFSKATTIVVLAAFLVLVFAGAASVQAATAVNLGTAGNFAVLGASTITNTGSTVLNGDLGLSPGTSVTGFPPGIVNGTQHITDAVAAQAENDLVTAYNNASGQTVNTTVSGDLGGQTLVPGVYNSASSLGLTGTLTLDGQNNPDAVFIFQIGSALTTASGSSVNLINSAQACNVFWQVGSSATLGTNSSFVGSLLVFTSITATTGASVNGRVLARNGAVTLDTSPITKPTCAAVVIPPVPVPVPIPTPTPVPTPVVTPIPIPTPVVVPTPVPTATSTSIAITPTVIPGLPNTGFNPTQKSVSVNVVTLAGIFMLALTSFVTLRKRLI